MPGISEFGTSKILMSRFSRRIDNIDVSRVELKKHTNQQSRVLPIFCFTSNRKGMN